MTAQVLNGERSLGVHIPLLQLLDLWKEHGGHDILVAPEGGYRFGPIDEAKQEDLFRTGLSKARTLRETPHGRRCAIDCWPVGFNPHRGFADASNVGMLAKFKAWGAFVDQYGPALGIRWGGHFAGFGLFGDMPHAEIANWATAYQFPSGNPVLSVVPPLEMHMADLTPARPEFLAQFFTYDHLPVEKQLISKRFGDLATDLIATLPSNPERTVALRKLLEAKDCAVRASFAKMGLILAMLVAALMLYAAPAVAQTVGGSPAPAPSGFGSILAGLLTPANIGGGVAGVLALIGGFQFFTAKRKRILALAAFHAFHIVEDVTNEMDDGPAKDAFNKAEAGLKAVDDYLVKNGWRPLKPGEAPAAALELQAIHGGEVAKTKLLVAQAEATVAAQTAAAPASPPPA